MAYHTIKQRGKKEYHYLVNNLRVGNAWKKINVYLGTGGLTEKQISKLIKDKTPALKDKTDNYLRSIDQLYNILPKGKIKELGLVKLDYQAALREMRPDELENYEEWFTVEFTYDTNSIEGSTLTKAEVSLLLYDNLVPKGKSLGEIYEATNHKKAYDFLKRYKGGLTIGFILKLHSILMANILEPKYAGHVRSKQVYIRGADFVPPKADKVAQMLRALIDWHKTSKNRYHPVVLAAYFHEAFEGIHPFIDGNGRTGRLLLNFILLKNGYPAVNIKSREKADYIAALKSVRSKNYAPLVNLLTKYLMGNPLAANYRENIKAKGRK